MSTRKNGDPPRTVLTDAGVKDIPPLRWFCLLDWHKRWIERGHIPLEKDDLKKVIPNHSKMKEASMDAFISKCTKDGVLIPVDAGVGGARKAWDPNVKVAWRCQGKIVFTPEHGVLEEPADLEKLPPEPGEELESEETKAPPDDDPDTKTDGQKESEDAVDDLPDELEGLLVEEDDDDKILPLPGVDPNQEPFLPDPASLFPTNDRIDTVRNEKLQQIDAKLEELSQDKLNLEWLLDEHNYETARRASQILANAGETVPDLPDEDVIRQLITNINVEVEALEEYRSATDDLVFLKDHRDKIESALRYAQSPDEIRDLGKPPRRRDTD